MPLDWIGTEAASQQAELGSDKLACLRLSKAEAECSVGAVRLTYLTPGILKRQECSIEAA